MQNLPVHWSEGMFLRPQHFQAADRHWNEFISASQRWDCHYNYGLRSIDISPEALGNYHLQVNACQARMQDGSLIWFKAGQGPDRVPLNEAFENNAEITAYLAVPKLDLSRANVTRDDAGGKFRYVELERSTEDESAGGSVQDIQYKQLDIRVMLSTDDMAGFEVLPICRLRRRAENDEAAPEIEVTYIAPILAVDAWAPLQINLIRDDIYDFIGRKIDVLCRRAHERKSNLASPAVGDIEDIWKLSFLNQAYAYLHCLTFAKGVHPFLAYRELCRVVGMLSIFDESKRISDIPEYDHDDIWPIFDWARRRIHGLLDSDIETPYEQRPFVGTKKGMEVTIDPNWLLPGWKWYVGVSGNNATDLEIRELLRRGTLEWKLGSAAEVDLIFEHRLPGVVQMELENPPRVLPPVGWIYYEIQQDNAGWRHVLADQSLAARFNTDIIGNLDSLLGKRALEVLWNNKRIILEISLFAVPTDKK